MPENQTEIFNIRNLTVVKSPETTEVFNIQGTPLGNINNLRHEFRQLIEEALSSATPAYKLDTTSPTGSFLLTQIIENPQYRHIPEKTKKLLTFLQENKLPVKLVPNKEPTLEGCDEAVTKREHAIPARENPFLPDELKTIIFKCGKTNPKYLAVHCRGNREIDTDKIQEIAKDKFKLSNKQAKYLKVISEEELDSKFSLEKGRVTPFIKEGIDLQIFDSDCIKSYGMPMTTNANDPNWSTQFECDKLIPALAKTQEVEIADIAKGGPSEVLSIIDQYRNTILGIVEYGSESSNEFYRLVTHYITRRLNSLHETKPDGEKIPFQPAGSFTELQTERTNHSSQLENIMEASFHSTEVERLLKRLINKLSTETNLIAVPCNILPHYLPESNGTKIISYPKATEIQIQKELEQSPQNSFLFLGGKSVSQNKTSIYQNQLPPEILEQSTFLNNEEAETIRKSMLKLNNGNEKEATQLLFEVLKNHLDQKTIVIASTSLSSLFQKTGKLLKLRHLHPKHWLTAYRINKKAKIDTMDAYAHLTANTIMPHPQPH